MFEVLEFNRWVEIDGLWELIIIILVFSFFVNLLILFCMLLKWICCLMWEGLMVKWLIIVCRCFCVLCCRCFLKWCILVVKWCRFRLVDLGSMWSRWIILLFWVRNLVWWIVLLFNFILNILIGIMIVLYIIFFFC